MGIQASNLRAKIDGRDYIWAGGFGCAFWSEERGQALGNVRCIGGRLFYAYSIDTRNRPPLVSWCPVGEVTIEGLRALRAEIFMGDSGRDDTR